MKGHLQRRGKDSWRLKFDLGRANAGERSTKYITIRGTKAQAQAQAAKIIASTVTGEFVDPSQETVASFGERWLRDWASQNLRGKALERYSELLRKYVFPRVGGLPIQKLQAADLQAIYAAMGNVSDATRLYVHRVTSRMLRHATQWGLTHRNVATLVDAPKAGENEVDVPTPKQVNTVLEVLQGDWLHPIVALGAGLWRASW